MDRFLTFILLFVASTTSQGIKNSPPDLTHQQYHGLQHHLNRGSLSAQQQSHIYSDVQQHRFQLAAGSSQHALQQPVPEYNSYQAHQQLPDITYQSQGFTPIKSPQLQNVVVQRPNSPPQQTFSTYSQEYNNQNQNQQGHIHPHGQQIPNYVQPLHINSQFSNFNQLPSLTHTSNQQDSTNYFPTGYQAPETPVRVQEPAIRIPPTRVALQQNRVQDPPRTVDLPRHHENRVEVPRAPEYSRNPYEEFKQQKPQEAPHPGFQGPLQSYKQQKAQDISIALPEYSRNPYEVQKAPEGPARVPEFNRNQYEEFKHPIQPLHDDRYNRKRPNTNPNQIHPQQYLTEVNSFNNDPNRYNNFQYTTQPAFLIETQPPSTRTQKPYEAITINDDQSGESKENDNSNPATPRTVKYRIRPTKKPVEETTKKRDKNHPVLYSKAERQKLYQQALLAETLGTTEATTARTPTRRATTTVQTTPPSDAQELDLQAELQKQIQEQLADKDNPYGTLKISLPASLTPEQIANLPQLALGDAFAQLSPAAQSVSGHDPSTLFHDHSQATSPLHPTPVPTTTRKHVKNIVAESLRTTPKPSTVSLEELTKGVLPPGANFEVIRQKQDGVLEEVDQLQNLPQKKVTFVILEEQPDGSVKVKGVQGNEDQGEQDVDSIIQKLKKGEIKLPPSNRNQATPQESIDNPSYVKHSTKDNNHYVNKYVQDTHYYNTPSTTPPTTTAYTTHHKHSTRNNVVRNRYEENNYYTTTTTTTTTTTQAPPKTSTRGAYIIRRRRPMSTTLRPTTTSSSTTTPAPTAYTVNSHSGPPFVTNLDPNRVNYQQNSYTPSQQYTTPSHFSPLQNNIPVVQDNTQLPPHYQDRSHQYPDQSQEFVEVSQYPDQSYTDQKNTFTEQPKAYNYHHHQPKIYTEPQKAFSEQPTQISSEEHATPQDVLHDILKSKGLYAMAKFLHQSGLDSVLNETGPYTIFVPTDKAFRTLLVQLGGPDRADQKFKENPRLLSGLLLHHVIPGAFSLSSLQDEMTGVSLAGTQLRVNTYTTQDSQWNDLKIVTINGAKVVGDMTDITVPQGIAHVVDRVMFPLPVGDIMQTLQADREQRFTRFIRLVQEAGVADMLTGTKTYTVFAPVDGAWSDEDVDKLLDHRAEARALVMKHITPGTLYSAGMHYYQLRDTMLSNKQISLFKESGRVKANNAQVVSRNIPATNGVIHAVDALL